MPLWNFRFDLRINLEDHTLVTAVAKAEALAGVIRGIPIPPYLRHKLDNLNILRAVRGTTGIEGSTLSEEEVSQVLNAPGDKHVLPKAREREEQEVRNANKVMQFVADTLRKKPGMPVTEDLIRRIQSLTTSNIPYEHNTPGEYRSHAVTAGSYIPPRSADEVRSLMRDFVQWLNQGDGSRLPPVVRALAAHFYLISIHPFGEGNGRTSRGVESFLLYQARINACGFYSLSNFYYRRRAQYIEMLDHVRFVSNGSLTPFLLFALAGLVEELEAVHAEILREVTVISFRDYAREALQPKLGTKTGSRMLFFLLGLAGRGEVSVRDLREGGHPLYQYYRGISARTLGRDLDFLIERKLIIAVNGTIRANTAIMESYKL